MSPFPLRLKQAREAAGLSQERLGILIGIDEGSASARMNQYERGKHAPDYATVEKIAALLKMPVAWFFAETDEEARLLAGFYHAPAEARVEFLREIESKYK